MADKPAISPEMPVGTHPQGAASAYSIIDEGQGEGGQIVGYEKLEVAREQGPEGGEGQQLEGESQEAETAAKGDIMAMQDLSGEEDHHTE